MSRVLYQGKRLSHRTRNSKESFAETMFMISHKSIRPSMHPGVPVRRSPVLSRSEERLV
ncbi:hypothetical protein IC582_016474 [Cucumis melo]